MSHYLDRIQILGTGVVTSVGLNAQANQAAVRADICRFSETMFLGKSPDPIVGAFLEPEELPLADPIVDAFPGVSLRQVRMLQLAGYALSEACEGVDEEEPIPAFLGLPDVSLEDEDPKNYDLINLLGVQSGIRLATDVSELYPMGRAAFMIALQGAITLLQSKTHTKALVGGMDTHWDADLLEQLDRQGRISSSDNPDGFIPGEGAAFLLLSLVGEANSTPKKNDTDVYVIDRVGLSFEPGHRFSTEPCLGNGLAACFSALWPKSHSEQQPIATVYAGFNGEHFDAKPWGVAHLRHAGHFHEPLVIEHPADCLGDTGAAMGAIMSGLAVSGMIRGIHPTPALVWCTSDHGHCGALVLSKLDSEHQ